MSDAPENPPVVWEAAVEQEFAAMCDADEALRLLVNPHWRYRREEFLRSEATARAREKFPLAHAAFLEAKRDERSAPRRGR